MLGLPSRRRFHRHDAVSTSDVGFTVTTSVSPSRRRFNVASPSLQRRISVSTSRHQFQRRDDSLPSRRQPDGERMTANGRRRTDDGERTTSVFNVRWKTSVLTADADRRHLRTEDVRSTTEPTHVVKPLSLSLAEPVVNYRFAAPHRCLRCIDGDDLPTCSVNMF